MSDREKLEYSGRLDAAHLAGYFDALAGALKAGAVRLAVGERAITLEPQGAIRVEVSASKDLEKGRSSLQVELSWQQHQPEPPAPDLEITAGGAA